MKTTTTIFFYLISWFNSFSQNIEISNINDNEIIADKLAIIKAEPKNGIDAFKIDFAKALAIPTKRIVEINEKQLRIITNFNVDEKGKISNIKIINDRFNLKDEIAKTFAALPDWNPAQENGKNISSNFSLPIVLNLSLPDYELDENRIPKIALQKADFDAFYYEFNSHMIYPRDFWERYHYKRGIYDTGINQTSSELKYEIKFVINEKGKFENIKTYVDGKYDSYLNASVKRALAKCNHWEPATVNGEKVKWSFTLPVVIKTD